MMHLHSSAQILQGSHNLGVENPLVNDPLAGQPSTHTSKLLPILAAVQSTPLYKCSHVPVDLEGSLNTLRKLHFYLSKSRKTRRFLPPASPTQKEEHHPPVLLTWGDEGIL